MFKYLFNTYESVDPPIYNHPERKTFLDDPLVPFQLESSQEEQPKPSSSKEDRKEEPLREAPALFDDLTPFEYGFDITPVNSRANSLVNFARQFVGLPYVSGGRSPLRGFDCSGLLSYVYSLNGLDIGYSTHDIFGAGTEVPSLSLVRVGDIICTPGTGQTKKHVKMVSLITNGQVYVIEAKGRQWGVIEHPLDRTDNITTIRRIIGSDNVPAPQPVQQASTRPTGKGKFSNRRDFIVTLTNAYKLALNQNGMDPNYAYVLVASASIESAWGASPSGTYNYGGVKSTNGKGTSCLTTDWVPGQGNIKRHLIFRDFASVLDYCNYMVRWLKTSLRYGNAFRLYSASLPLELWRYVLNHGYGGGSQSNINTYIGWMRDRYNQIRKVV